jgi:hypothetical protein
MDLSTAHSGDFYPPDTRVTEGYKSLNSAKQTESSDLNPRITRFSKTTGYRSNDQIKKKLTDNI